MSDTHQLISAIYAATLVPDDFNGKFDKLDALLFGEAANDDAPRNVLDPATETHVANARSIQERIGRVRTREQRIGQILESIPNPSYLVTPQGAVVAANGLALARLGATPLNLAACIADEEMQRRVRDFISRDSSGRLLAVAGHIDRAASAGQTSVLVRRVDDGLLPGESGALFLLSIVDLGFDEETVDLFRSAYELTEAESRVAVLLASGLTLADIAAERQVSIDTVRTQLKLIKSKTGARDIPALVRLVCGFNAGALASSSPAQRAPALQRSADPRPRRRMVLRDGRTLEYVEQGAPDGMPVLLFHNLPYGVDLPLEAVREATARGLRFIAPFRPGFAGSSPIDDRGDDRLTRAAEDAQQLLAHLGIARAVLLSHAAGAAFALRFARLFPRSVTRLIGVSRAPAWRNDWLAGTPPRQRFMLRLTRHTPSMLPVVAWAMVACMESTYAREFVAYNCRDGAADSRAAADPQIADLIANGSVEALHGGLDAFCRECELALTDSTIEARATLHKFHILQGADDRIVPPTQSLAFAADVPGTTVELVEGAGQLLFFSHWRRIFDTITAETSARVA